MQPPAYSGEPRKKSNVGLIVGIVVLCVGLCCILPIGLLVKGGMGVFQGAMGMVGCSTSMESLRNGVIGYAKAHDGVLPPAKGWEEAILPYVKAPVLPPNTPMKPPSPESGVCDQQNNTFVAYNASVAGKKLASFDDRDATVVLFEVPQAGRDQAIKYTEQPFKDSPKMVSSLPRGWLTIALGGPSFVINQNGVKTPISGGRTRSGVSAEVHN